MSSRNLSDLKPIFIDKVIPLQIAWQRAGLDVLIYCTLRLDAEQDALYAIGRTLPGRIVTNARGGESAHNYGLALDGAPLIHGRIAWDDHPHWALYGKVAMDCGLEWAGAPSYPFKEMPHVQLADWKSYI